MKNRINYLWLLIVFAWLILGAGTSWAADSSDNGDKSSAMRMMERVEVIVYGEPGKGGVIERLNNAEKELFGRSLPGSISERHTAILNFLEVGTPDQPSMLFKLSIAEWIVGHSSLKQEGALKRVENMETELDGEMQYGKPLAMRVERLLTSLVAEPVTSQEVVLPKATVLKMKFLEELSPAKTKKGNAVGVALTDDLFVNSVLVAPKGSLVRTSVRYVKQPGRYGIPSEIQLDFIELEPLGPQRPQVVTGAASKKAAEDVSKNRDKGEGAIIGAGAATIGGAIALGPLGALAGIFVRGEAIKIPEGSVMFMETSDDVSSITED